MVDKSWRLGTVLEREDDDFSYPDSTFRCFQIRWDGDEEDAWPEHLSPWEMEVIPDDFGTVHSFL